MKLRDLFGGLGKAAQKVRGFDGAKVSRLTSDWVDMPRIRTFEQMHKGQALIARSRDLAINDDYTRRFLSVAKSNVVGPNGITVQSRVKLRNGQPDTRAIEGIEAAWRAWCRRGVCDRAGRQDFVGLQRLALDSLLRDGEALIALVQDDSRSNPSGLQVQLLDAVTLDFKYNEKLRSGNVVTNGVEHDDAYRPVAYWFNEIDPHVPVYARMVDRRRRIPVENVLHLFIQEEVLQLRGWPQIVSAMWRLKMLKGYEEAELVAARTAAAKMGFFERSSEGVGFEGDDETSDGDLYMDAEPGSLAQLPEGVTFKGWDPSHPTTAYADYTKSVLRGIASGLGMSYNALANDLEGVNFSSIRAGVLEDREVWKGLQEFLVSGMIRPIYEAWLTRSLLAGAINSVGASGPGAPLPNDAASLERFMAASYQGRRWSWVDPLKDIQAAKQEIDMGARSVSSVIRERGGDPEETWQEIARDRERMEALGITPQDALESMGEPADAD